MYGRSGWRELRNVTEDIITSQMRHATYLIVRSYDLQMVGRLELGLLLFERVC